MEVKAIHQIIRRGASGKQEIIKPGTVFETTGEELADLKAAKAISTEKADVREARVRSEIEGADDEQERLAQQTRDEVEAAAKRDAEANAKTAAAAEAAKTAKPAAPAAKTPAAKAGTGKAAAPAKSASVAAAEKKAADTKEAADAKANEAAANAAGTDKGNTTADEDGSDLL